ncbi:MAG: hypothetical protein RI947_1467 [Candidatus Parcubacteria bacterium]|jgi:phosphoserine phosphatase
MIKAVLLDFDGTLVNKDILDVVCGIVGKEEASDQINRDFHAGKLAGLAPIITRINFLTGVTIEQINRKLDENAYLVKGAKELVTYLNEHGIPSILNSGNIIPVLSYYQKLLGIPYLVGTKPQMEGDTIIGIGEEDFAGRDFKVIGVKEILSSLSIAPADTLAIGDSIADKTMFEFAGHSIAINPKNGVGQFADIVIEEDLSKVIPIIQNLNNSHE